MPLHAHNPAPPLSRFIHLLWLMEGEPVSHDRERVLPDGSVEIVFNLRDDRIRACDPHHPDRFEELHGAIISGPRSKFMVIDTESEQQVMGIHFRPGGAYPFLATPTRELVNQTLSLDELWGEASVELRHRLVAATTHADRFVILERVLLTQLRNLDAPHPAVAWALAEIERSRESRPLMDITGEIGLSSRRFIELFSREVGLTPKRYNRVRRFQRAVQTVHTADEIHWADLAVTSGYYDQAHFIHDFRDFCGLTPSAYFEHRNLRHPNHVPLGAAPSP